MYEFECEATFAAEPDAVWKVWTDVARWPDWDVSKEMARLDGPFEPGSSGWARSIPRPAVRRLFHLGRRDRHRRRALTRPDQAAGSLTCPERPASRREGPGPPAWPSGRRHTEFGGCGASGR